MLSYQTKYIENTKKIAAQSDFYGITASDFPAWFALQKQAAATIEKLRQENIALLSENLFPVLDDLHNADNETIALLEEFAETLLDWRTNLDCGVYLLIYDSLLSLYRVRGNRDGIIKCLYKVGMGHFYQNRTVEGIGRVHTASFFFENEMIFTEAGSYLKYFAEIENEETRGYIIRALANIAICAIDLRKRVAISSRILKIVRDDYYRSLAPSLPWDRFLRATNQQMSANRGVLSRGNLSADELAAVLESCYEVFKPETANENPNVRWLWPYYEMEYSCGFVDLATTLDRLEMLIERTAYHEYDVAGLYGNIQLPIYYGSLLHDNPSAIKPRHIRFLASAYEKMMHTILTIPTEDFIDFFFYAIRLVITDYYEAEGVPTYREITAKLMKRLTGQLYIQSRRMGEVLKLLCGAILDEDPTFFDDIDFIRVETDPTVKRNTVLSYALECGLYHDFGLIKMNLDRLRRTRSLFDKEDTMFRLHTISGHDDLAARASTARFADIALGHHAWYNGAGGYPEDYVRNASPYRQMTDAAAVAVYLTETYDGDIKAAVKNAVALERTRFSPLVTAYLENDILQAKLDTILCSDAEPFYREIYDEV